MIARCGICGRFLARGCANCPRCSSRVGAARAAGKRPEVRSGLGGDARGHLPAVDCAAYAVARRWSAVAILLIVSTVLACGGL